MPSPANTNEASALMPEAQLLLLACASTHSADDITPRVRALIQNEIDWDRLLRLEERHRIVPLLYRQLQAANIESLPPAILARLRNHFYLSTVHNHLLATELSAMLKLFADNSIPVVPYKGPVLALELYGDISLRQFGDLDLLVHREDVPRAAALLNGRGYRQQHQLTRPQEASLLRTECEHLFARAADQLYVDLHWEFVPRYFSLRLKAEGFWPRLVESSFEGAPALSFKTEDLLLILCVHAAKEFWERLIWLCDLAQLTNSHPGLNWPQVIRQATQTGTRRMLLVSLSLAQDLLLTKLPPDILRLIEADSAIISLTAQIKQQLFQDTIATSGISRYLSPSRALERRRDRMKFHLRLALTASPEDWAFVRLPDKLTALYSLVRPFRLASKYLLPARPRAGS
jgi:hypothetical protein